MSLPELKYHRWEKSPPDPEIVAYNAEVDAYNARVQEVIKRIQQLSSCHQRVVFEGKVYRKPHEMQIIHMDKECQHGEVQHMGRVYDDGGHAEGTIIFKTRGVHGDREFLALYDAYYCQGCEKLFHIAVGSPIRDSVFVRKCRTCDLQTWDDVPT